MTKDLKTGPLREARFANLLREVIDQSDDSCFTQSMFDEKNLYYTVPWMNRVVVVDRRTKSVKFDASGWGFKSLESAYAFARDCSRSMYSLDPGEDESSRTGVDFCDLC